MGMFLAHLENGGQLHFFQMRDLMIQKAHWAHCNKKQSTLCRILSNHENYTCEAISHGLS